MSCHVQTKHRSWCKAVWPESVSAVMAQGLFHAVHGSVRLTPARRMTVPVSGRPSQILSPLSPPKRHFNGIRDTVNGSEDLRISYAARYGPGFPSVGRFRRPTPPLLSVAVPIRHVHLLSGRYVYKPILIQPHFTSQPISASKVPWYNAPAYILRCPFSTIFRKRRSHSLNRPPTTMSSSSNNVKSGSQQGQNIKNVATSTGGPVFFWRRAFVWHATIYLSARIGLGGEHSRSSFRRAHPTHHYHNHRNMPPHHHPIIPASAALKRALRSRTCPCCAFRRFGAQAPETKHHLKLSVKDIIISYSATMLSHHYVFSPHRLGHKGTNC